MPYTVWSRGRLFGKSELAYRRTFPKLRAGDFLPSELGQTLMPVFIGEGPALSALYDVAIRMKEEPREPGDADEDAEWPRAPQMDEASGKHSRRVSRM